MLRHRFAVVLAVALSSGLGPLAHAARFAAPPSVRQKFDREYLITHMRVAAADRLIEQNDEIAAYLAAQFNTIVLYDIEGALPKSEERIAYETSFARSHHLHILLGKPTEVTPPVSDDEIRERLSLWDRYGHDDVLGVFFVHDDVFFLHTTAERQRHLYALAHAIVPDWAVFGIIGEMGFDASSEEVAQYFDPSAFDHLLVIMYPLNTGYLTGVQLDSANAADPDADMRGYVQRYVSKMGEKFVAQLQEGQSAILVIQAFAYNVESIGRVPRPADILIQATLGGAVLRSVPGQERYHSIAYFLWDGARAGMFGLWQRPDWMTTVEQANRLEEVRGGEVRLNP